MLITASIWLYDELGRTVSKTDQAGKTTQFFYDALGRLTKVKDALNQETTYSYNELGQQLTQTDANSRTMRFEYDQLGRRVKRILPAGQFETYSYDTGGNLQSRTDFNGKTTTFGYDQMRRLLTKVPDASLNQPAISFTYNANGQRATMTDASGATVYTYDVRNRLATKQTPFGTLSYTYDDAGNLLTTRSSNANGVSVDYTYDVLNRLRTTKDNRLSALNGGVTSYDYDAVGNLESYQYPNGVTTSYNYSTLNRLTSMDTATGAGTLSSYVYTLGPAGNRTAVSELSGRTVTYTYDDLYRLTNEMIANDPLGINGSVGYNYDAVGNRLSRTSSVTGVPSQTSTFDANDRLNSDNYDANGNTTASNSNSYAYDFENRLTSLNNGSVTYVYDGDGNRVAKTVNGVTTNYLVDTNNHTGYAQVVEELQSGSVTRSFTFGHDLISQRIVGGSLSFYSYDGHGSVRQLTDASASITDTYDYDAFGILIHRTGTTPNDYLYSGEQFETHLGLYYLRARYLNSSVGRFWTADSYEGIGTDPATLHRYLNSNANPVTHIDPSGHTTIAEQVNLGAIIGILATATVLTAAKVVSDIVIVITLHPQFPRPSPSPSPVPSPVPQPIPLATPEDNSQRYVNFDTSTVEAIAMEGSTETGNIFSALAGRQILMCATAIGEVQYRRDRFAGLKERRRVDMLLSRVTPITDSPDPQVMAVPDPNGTRLNDKIIFGTGQSWRVQTFTADRTFVEHARSNGVVWTPYPYIHGSGRFTDSKIRFRLNFVKVTTYGHRIAFKTGPSGTVRRCHF